MSRLLHMVFVLFIGVGLHGQSFPDLSFTRYGIEEGIPNLSMNLLGQDSTGYIWLKDPLTRFDGKNFKPYLIDENDKSLGYISQIKSMADDGHGNLMFAGKNGVYIFDRDKEYVTQVPSYSQNADWRRIFYEKPNTFWDIGSDRLVKIELPGLDTTVRLLKDDVFNNNFSPKSNQDVLWVNVDGDQTVRKIDLHTLLSKDYIIPDIESDLNSAIVYDDNDQLYLISVDGIWTYAQDKDTFIRKLDAKTITIDGNHFQYLKAVIHQNNMWFYDTVNCTLYRYDLLTEETEYIRYGKDISSTGMLPLTKDIILIGSTNSGLAKIDIHKKTIDRYTLDKKIGEVGTNNFIMPQLKTGNNVIFLSGTGQGLLKVDQKKLKFETIISPGNNSTIAYTDNIRAFEAWKDKIIVSSILDINIFDPIGKSFSDLPVPGPLPLPKLKGVFDIAKDNYNNLLLSKWSSTPTLLYFDYVNNRVISLQKHFPQIDFSVVFAFYLDSQNNFWLASEKKIIKIPASILISDDPKKGDTELEIFDMTPFLLPERNSVYTYAYQEDEENQIWVGTNFGLFCINPDNKKMTYYKNKPDDKKSLGLNDICSLKKSSKENVLWIGTVGGGINRLDLASNEFERISEGDGLIDNTIYTLEEDLEGNLWMGTNKGLCMYNPSSKESLAYTPEDGLQDYEFNRNAVLKTKDDLLLFGGVKGFNMFDPSKLTSGTNTSNLVLTSFKINDIESVFAEHAINLSYNQNFLKFEFNLLDYYNSDKIQYAHKMEGLEDDWNYTGKSNVASYPGLRPGNYSLIVKAANSEGQWSENIVLKSISISGPWYTSWWFVFLSLSVISTILYNIYRNRQNQKEKIIQLRNRISQDLHDEIGSTLSSISLFGAVAQKMVDTNSEGSQEMLTRINESTTQVMESINDIVWAINSENDKIDNLFKRMRAFASELSDTSDIRVTLDINEKIKETSINMVQRRNVYLIFKEAVNNAFKYSKASHIHIELIPFNKKFQLTIVDDGIGFEKEQLNVSNKLGGNGLKNMAHRAKEMEGILEVISAKNQGTEIRFTWNPNFEPKLNNKK